MHVLGHDPAPGDDVSGKDRRRFEALVERRAGGEPIPYIKGYAEFRGIELLTKPGVFVPRDSSEFLAEQAIRRLRRRKHPVHVDVATGGGTIALAVADEVPKPRSGAPTWRATRCVSRARTRRRSASGRASRSETCSTRFRSGCGDPSTWSRSTLLCAGRRDRRPARRDPRLGTPAHPHRSQHRRPRFDRTHRRGSAALAPDERMAVDGGQSRPGQGSQARLHGRRVP